MGDRVLREWRSVVSGSVGVLVGAVAGWYVTSSVIEGRRSETRFRVDVDIVRTLAQVDAALVGPGATPAEVVERMNRVDLPELVTAGPGYGRWTVEAEADRVVGSASVPERPCRSLEAGRRHGGRCSNGTYRVDLWTPAASHGEAAGGPDGGGAR